MSHVIVLGGGLSGLSAAHTILQSGGNTILLDKNPFMGGNSTKATSGINGAGTDAQKKLGIKDSVEIFEKDTALGGSKKQTEIPTELQRVLTGNSPHAVNWLKSAFGLDLTLVSRLGGHSMPRTHRGKEKFPGMVITYALMQEYERICEETPARAQLHLKARATQLLQDDDGNVIGVKYEKDGKSNSLYGPVVIATGGYGAGGLSKTSLLHDVRPDLTHLPTTNGTHCTGDGVSMVRAINGGTVDLNDVQVHPTGLVSPVDPDARVKFLAAGALRGCGGVILDNKGHRFCDELGTRDYVTGRMWEHKSGPYRLVLNGAASNEIEWHCKHYQGRGLMKKFDSGAALAQEIGCSVSTLEKTFEAYNTSAKTLKDPWNKKFFPNTPLKTNDYFYVAQITPVVHYTMGGVNILPTGEVTKADGTTPIKGLFAAGEAVGGVHGRNRLGGSALLECVVFGRVSGAAAANYHYKQLASGRAAGRASRIAGQLLPGGVVINVDKEAGRLTLEVGLGGGAAAPAAAAPAAAAPAAPAAPKQKEYTMEEVAKHTSKDDIWVVVNGQVLDVTTFLDDHPGGAQALLLYGGKDATEEFDMLHNADVIPKYAAHCIIGTVKK